MNRQAPRIPMRTCIGCRTRRPQADVLRIAKISTGIVFDPHRQFGGRGAAVCPQPSCIDAARRRGAGALRRALKGGHETDAIAALDAAAATLGEHRASDEAVRSVNA